MARNRRSDPYKAFNFRVLFGAVVAGVAALGIFRRLFARLERRPPGVYIEETPAGARPIEGVGTSTDLSVRRRSKRRGGRHLSESALLRE